MKFAYLIMAHDNLEQLILLLHMLDYPENDIYLHIDAKSDIDPNKCSKNINYANIRVYKKYKVYWGDETQTRCQFFLLGEAIKTYHDYYHLLSGHDLPLKHHSEIISFFEENKGKQFIHFESINISNKEMCRYYHFLWPWLSRKRQTRINGVLSRIESASINIQKKMKIHRRLYRGANWFSITHDFAEDFYSNKKYLLKAVRWTKSSDECVLQTFYMVKAKEKYVLYEETKDEEDHHPIVREIDWLRGTPYVWTMADLDLLKSSDGLYARKFDWNVDKEIIMELGKQLND